jgi:hypothetical protein
VQVQLTKNGAAALKGRLEIEVPAGWPVIEPIPFEIAAAESALNLVLELRRPPNEAAGSSAVSVRALTDDGSVFDRAYSPIDYPHIRSVAQSRPARLEIQSVALELPQISSVAYVRGASDRVPESLLEVGLPLQIVSSSELIEMESEELDALDAIVIGSRAYETDGGLAEVNQRLLDYVSRGGLLLVQYQQYQFARSGYAPYSLTISRPHDRITDQGAAVEVLDPEHPAMQAPHVLGDADWRGWVQERGLYFAGTWDDAYQPLLRMQDPEMSPLDGALLVASHGQGTYVYTALAFFRQLPAGVPGAYRLFMNLLNLGI